MEVVGARQLRATMRRAELDMADMKATHAKVAGIVATRATQLAPKRTGRLAATIRPAGTQTQAIIRAGYARVPYAQPIHWGWPRRNIRGNPWMSTAATTTELAWFAAYSADIDRILDQIRGT